LTSSFLSLQAPTYQVYTGTAACRGWRFVQTVELSGSDDDGAYAISIPFTWWFLGASYTTVYVGTNG
jgi:hypothetical protein